MAAEPVDLDRNLRTALMPTTCKRAGAYTPPIHPDKPALFLSKIATIVHKKGVSALRAVESYLKMHGVSPVGRPFGRYRSEQNWDAGYPVPPGTRVEAPFELVSLPAGLAASVVVNGPWANDYYRRWAAFLKSVVEQGYVPAGPPMAIWSGEDAVEKSQSTEMRIPVTKAN